MKNRIGTGTTGLLVLLTALAGCFGDDGEEQEATATTTATGEGNQTMATVRITEFPELVNVTEPILVEWVVEPKDNATLEVTSTAIHWANHSVSDPESPADYGNKSGESVSTTPGNFSANFTLDQPDTIYLRAHALIDGVNHWSEEVAIEVGGTAGETATVTISSAALGVLSGFEPEEITINVGDSIVWKNDDNEQHTATAEDGSFDTGDIAGGSSSTPIVFSNAGTFDYMCSNHPQTMMGTVTVTEA